MLSDSIIYVNLGESNTCLILNKSHQNLVCVGKNRNGMNQIPAEFNSHVNFVATSYFHSCVQREQDNIICWGLNNYGQTDLPLPLPQTYNPYTSGNNDEELHLSQFGDFVAVGLYFSCADLADQSVVCWGDNSHGQLDLPSTAGIKKVREYVTGSSHACLLRVSPLIQCWGANKAGQTSIPEELVNITNRLAAGFQHSCALTSMSKVECWGLLHAQSRRK